MLAELREQEDYIDGLQQEVHAGREAVSRANKRVADSLERVRDRGEGGEGGEKNE